MLLEIWPSVSHRASGTGGFVPGGSSNVRTAAHFKSPETSLFLCSLKILYIDMFLKESHPLLAHCKVNNPKLFQLWPKDVCSASTQNISPRLSASFRPPLLEIVANVVLFFGRIVCGSFVSLVSFYKKAQLGIYIYKRNKTFVYKFGITHSVILVLTWALSCAWF